MAVIGFPEDLTRKLAEAGVVAVLMIDELETAVPVAQALLRGGVNVMELTLRTPVALDALQAIRAEVPEMLAGIGTILTPEQVNATVAAGGTFGVSPGLNPRVVRAAQEAGLPFAPGVCTPSDVEAALELGCRSLKFFPCEPSGGLPFLKSMAAPFAHLGVKFVPLGGVNAENMSTYLADDSILAVGGSWLAPKPLIQARDYASIEARAAAARATADSI